MCAYLKIYLAGQIHMPCWFAQSAPGTDMIARLNVNIFQLEVINHQSISC